MAESRGETEESDNAVDEKTNTNRLAEAIKLLVQRSKCITIPVA